MTENQTTATAAPAKEAKVVTTRRCTCGCGEATSSTKTMYKPGHDARHAGSVARDYAAFLIDGGDGTNHSMLDELPTANLQHKAREMAKRIVAEFAAKATKAANKKAPKAPKASRTEKRELALKVAEEEDAHAAEEAAKRAEAEAAISDGEAEEAEAIPSWEFGTVKVGRWEYPSRFWADGEVHQRNTRRDGSGEWVTYEAK